MSKAGKVVETNGLEIAIISMAGRFPGADSVDKFWENLRDGVESITHFTEEELRTAGVHPTLLANQNYVKAKALLDNVENFDASFFGFSPREAEITDPQQRIFLECVWEAIERAGYDPDSYKGKIGLYAGKSISQYLLFNLLPNRELTSTLNAVQVLTANDKDHINLRVSYKLNLRGPSVNVQTTCSTSLVAVHLACQSLLSGECNMAVAGGSSIEVPHKSGYMYMEGGIESPDGHCRAFDVKARGIVGGSGVAAILLKRLEDALKDGDNVLAVIKGSAINNDGSAKIGYTAPSQEGQASAIRAAQIVAGVEPETISYVEAHGTGTFLGDPIEIAALKQVFSRKTSKRNFCAVGTLKTNVGHLDTVAGVAGLIKTVLALKHKMIPPSLHFESPNSRLGIEESPFYINSRLREWEAEAYPRRAGVSSFGIGGTNAHVVVEEAPESAASDPTSRSKHLLLLSAKSETALESATYNLSRCLAENAASDIADIAYTLQVGRAAFTHRRMVVCDDALDGAAALDTREASRVFTSMCENKHRPVAFMFPGQGSQHINMGLELYRAEPYFRAQIDKCSELLKPLIGLDLRDVIFPAESSESSAAERLTQTAITQPALFAIEYALAEFWKHLGIQPHAMTGHSIGEYVAACQAGVFSLEDGLKLVAARGRLIQKADKGAMLTVPLTEREAMEFTNERISLAAVNGPSLCVLSGEIDAIEEAKSRLIERGVSASLLHTSHAFHSHMMEPLLEEFESEIRKVKLNDPQLPFISNLSGTWITAEEAKDPKYWTRHLRGTVRFAEGLTGLFADAETVLLEVGPGQSLFTMARRHPDKPAKQSVLASLPHHRERESDAGFFLKTLGQLWLAGAEINRSKIYHGERRKRVPLPTYPFERKRYWVDVVKRQEQQADAIAKRAIPAVESEFQSSIWKESPLPSAFYRNNQTTDKATWLLFVDECGIALDAAASLKQAGHEVITVIEAERFSRTGEGDYQIDPQSSDDYESLFEELQTSERMPDRIIHFWGVTSPHKIEEDRYQRIKSFCSDSLLHLAKAIGGREGAGRIEMAVVFNDLYNVEYDAEPILEKSLLIGASKAIQQQYPDISSRAISINLADAEGKMKDDLIALLIAELRSTSAETVIAYQGRKRWVRALEPVFIEGEQSARNWLREGGVYLLAAGMSDTGIEAAKFLANEANAKLAICDQFDLTSLENAVRVIKRKDDESGDAEDLEPHRVEQRIDLNLDDETEDLIQIERKIMEGSGIKKIETYEGLIEKLNRLCSALVFKYFKSCDIDTSRGACYKYCDLKTRMRILPEFGKLFDFMLKILREDQIIAREGDDIEFLSEPEEIRAEELIEQYPDFTGMIKLLEHCVGNFDKALTGDMPPLAVLYPDGSNAFINESFETTVEHSQCRIYLMLFYELVRKVLKEAKGKPVRILEVGAGDGTLTRVLIPALLGANVEYHFTDIGKTYIVNAQKEAAAHRLNFLKFGMFDITKEPEEQGYHSESFDIVVAFNVVHATRILTETIGNLKNMLAPNGLLCIIEATKEERWQSLTWGLQEGWWYFQDHDLRPDSMCLTPDRWEFAMGRHDFKSVKTFPLDGENRATTDHGLIIGQQAVADSIEPNIEPRSDDARFAEQELQLAHEIERLGGEALFIQTDLCSREQVQAAVKASVERFGRIDGVLYAATNTDSINDEQISRTILSAGIIDQALEDARLDFFVLLSSQDSTAKGLDRLSCDSSGEFLDNFAHHLAMKRSGRAVSINWQVRQDSNGGSGIERLPRGWIKKLDRIMSSNTGPQVSVTLPLASSSEKSEFIEGITEEQKRIDEAAQTPKVEVAQSQPSELSVHSRPLLDNAYVAARNEIEECMVAIWEDLFGIRPVGVYDNFFSLGGDSLLALQLNARLAKSFAVTLPMHSLLEAPTISELAIIIESFAGEDGISSKRPAKPALPSVLVEIQRGSHLQSIFFIHPGGGGVFAYRELAHLLDPDGTFYAIQPRGIDGKEEMITVLEEMAAYYIDAIRVVQAHGPYVLAGSSFGGAMAYEMARQLEAAGEQITLAALFDTPGPRQLAGLTQDEVDQLREEGSGEAHSSREDDESADDVEQLLEFLQDLDRTGDHLESAAQDRADRIVNIWQTNVAVLSNYELKPYGGKVAFFRASERSEHLPRYPELPWIEAATEGIEVHIVPGGHDSMLRSPNVEVLASRLKKSIDEARRLAKEEAIPAAV